MKVCPKLPSKPATKANVSFQHCTPLGNSYVLFINQNKTVIKKSWIVSSTMQLIWFIIITKTWIKIRIMWSYHDIKQQFTLCSMENLHQITNSLFPDVKCMGSGWSCFNTTQRMIKIPSFSQGTGKFAVTLKNTAWRPLALYSHNLLTYWGTATVVTTSDKQLL